MSCFQLGITTVYIQNQFLLQIQSAPANMSSSLLRNKDLTISKQPFFCCSRVETISPHIDPVKWLAEPFWIWATTTPRTTVHNEKGIHDYNDYIEIIEYDLKDGFTPLEPRRYVGMSTNHSSGTSYKEFLLGKTTLGEIYNQEFRITENIELLCMGSHNFRYHVIVFRRGPPRTILSSTAFVWVVDNLMRCWRAWSGTKAGRLAGVTSRLDMGWGVKCPESWGMSCVGVGELQDCSGWFVGAGILNSHHRYNESTKDSSCICPSISHKLAYLVSFSPMTMAMNPQGAATCCAMLRPLPPNTREVPRMLMDFLDWVWLYSKTTIPNPSDLKTILEYDGFFEVIESSLPRAPRQQDSYISTGIVRCFGIIRNPDGSLTYEEASTHVSRIQYRLQMHPVANRMDLVCQGGHSYRYQINLRRKDLDWELVSYLSWWRIVRVLLKYREETLGPGEFQAEKEGASLLEGYQKHKMGGKRPITRLLNHQIEIHHAADGSKPVVSCN